MCIFPKIYYSLDFLTDRVYHENNKTVHVHGARKNEIGLKWRVIMLYIGVDLGTSAVKLLLMEGSGKIVNIVSKEYPLFFPHPGWSEQRPEDWYEQSMAGIK